MFCCIINTGAMNKINKDDLFGVTILLIAIALIPVVYPLFTQFLNSFNLYLTPSQTLYLSSNMFPLKANGSIKYNPVIFSFNGVPLANGTECINSVKIYPFNYTTQKYSSSPLSVTNSTEIAKIYYNVGMEYHMYGFNKEIQIPQNSTLLCPSVVKVIKG